MGTSPTPAVPTDPEEAFPTLTPEQLERLRSYGTGRAALQALKFGAELSGPRDVASHDASAEHLGVIPADGTEITTSAVVMDPTNPAAESSVSSAPSRRPAG